MSAARLRICVACVEAAAQWQVELDLPPGSTLADAVERSGLLARVAAPAELEFAVFGRRATPAMLLADGDRIELTRPLMVDARAARQLRARATAARRKSRAGKPDAKPAAKSNVKPSA